MAKTTALNMNAQVEAEVRVRTLLAALRGLLECAQLVEENSMQLASCLFLTVELGDAVERLISLPKPAND